MNKKAYSLENYINMNDLNLTIKYKLLCLSDVFLDFEFMSQILFEFSYFCRSNIQAISFLINNNNFHLLYIIFRICTKIYVN